MTASEERRQGTLRYILNELFGVAMMAVIAAVLTAALFMQYGRGEIPCPLCLLQRVAMLGVCFGLMLNFRNGFSDRNTGYGLLFSVFLLIVAVRQTLLDIYPRPGHEYVGSAVLGLHMPVWSVIIAVALITGFALKLCIIGTEDGARPPNSSSLVGRFAAIVGLYVIALAVVNFASVVVQCGLGQCHTTGYALLK
ncbi:disulfide bond formation protein B [Sphingomonas daechungensis]|jgi:disulfide bond formation protein DsbB|uniref:disulfide bond formation protein B n=1 Tax=Sphingomonas daechungensis TaxID=1176646 RepID=UPI003784CACF